MLRIPILLLAAAWGLAAGAETYKWVDERGVVNYSNTPPAAAAGAKASRVEERVSTYESDPALLRTAAARAAAPRPDYTEIEWLQRQRFMMMQQAAMQSYGDLDCDYRVDCRTAYLPSYYPYFVPASFARRRPVVRPTFFISQAPRARASRPGFLMPLSRGRSSAP